MSKEHSKKHSRNKNLQQEGLPAPKQNDEIKTNILTLKELLRNHGWPEAHLLTKARLFGGCYTDVLSEEMKGTVSIISLLLTTFFRYKPGNAGRHRKLPEPRSVTVFLQKLGNP